MYISNRYSNIIAKWLDGMSFLFMNPWLTVCSRFGSCYISTTFEKQYPQIKLVDYFILSPLYAVLITLLLPVGALGIVIWLLLCAVTDQEKYTYVYVDENTPHNLEDRLKNLGTYTLATANVLLVPEAIARLNNNKCSYARASKIAKQILNHTGKPLRNLIANDDIGMNTKNNSILAEFPCLDFLCLQEVWERSYALVLIEHLKEEFSYFLYDIGDYSFSKNFCMLGSGLFFASKKPILNADFNIFTRRTKHAKFTSQGILCIKVLLYFDEYDNSHVGYIANVHTQAFEGSEVILLSQLTDILIFVSLFKEKNALSDEIIDFDIICGDFNADNMSPADMCVQRHSLFGEYQDICVMRPGQDTDWAIGTELRQCSLYQPDILEPANFRKVLVDDSLRRLYVLDADVVIHSMHLMTSTVQPGPAGYIRPLPYGGKRRVDRILYKGSTREIIGYCFLSALTNLTDHLPVCMTWKLKDS